MDAINVLSKFLRSGCDVINFLSVVSNSLSRTKESDEQHRAVTYMKSDASLSRLRPNMFSYMGTKDKRAITVQEIAVHR